MNKTLSSVSLLLSILLLFLSFIFPRSTKHINTNRYLYQCDRIYAQSSCNRRYALKSIHLSEKLITILNFDNDRFLCRATDKDIDELIMFNAHLATIEWRFDLLDCYNVDRDDIKAVMADKNIFMSVSDRIICIEKYSGKCLWESHIVYPRHGNSNMVMHKGKIYIPSRHYILCYNSNNALLEWKKWYLNYDDDPDMDITIRVFDESLFIRKGGCVYRMDPDTGENIWEYHGKYDAFSKNMVITDKYLIVDADLFQYIYLDIQSGEIVRDNKGQFSLYKPLLVDNYILYSSDFTDYTNLSMLDENFRSVWTNSIHHEELDLGNYLMIETSEDSVFFPVERIRYSQIICDKNLILIFSPNTLWIIDKNTSHITQTLKTKQGFESCFHIHQDNMDKVYSSSVNGLYEFVIASDSLTYKLNSNTYNPDNDKPREMDSQPTIKNGRTLLPARYVVEPLGGQVFWDGEQRKVTCKLVAPDNPDTDEYKENIVELWIDKPTARVNGVEVQIDPDNPDVVPTIINDRTMVPMRFLAESLGCEVKWIAETKEIILTYTP